MNQHEAEALLELVPGEAISVRAVRAAFARQIKATHPDTAPDRGASLEKTVKSLKAARDLLLAHLNGLNLCCTLCKGVGTIQGRLGRKECVACNGTGDKFR